MISFIVSASALIVTSFPYPILIRGEFRNAACSSIERFPEGNFAGLKCGDATDCIFIDHDSSALSVFDVTWSFLKKPAISFPTTLAMR